MMTKHCPNAECGHKMNYYGPIKKDVEVGITHVIGAYFHCPKCDAIESINIGYKVRFPRK